MSTALMSSEFLRMNAVFFGGSLLVAFLNYLYYPVLGRMLPTSDFGEVQVAVSQFMQMTTVLSVLTLVSVNILVSERDSRKATRTIDELEKMTLYAGIGVLVLVALFAEPLRAALKFDSIWPLIATAGVFVAAVPLSFRTAYLRGKKDFVSASASGAIMATAKLLLSVLLVILGMRAFGAVLGLLLAQLVALIYTTYRAKKIHAYERQMSAGGPDWSLLRPQLKYAGFVLAVTLLVTLQVSIDATIVKYFFTPEAAGLYAGVATIARIIFFLAASITVVLLSAVTYTKKPAENQATLKKSLILMTLISGGATLLFALFPRLVLGVMLGQRYLEYAHLLPWLSLMIFAASIANLLATYLVALHRYVAILPAAIGAAVTYIGVVVWHDTIDHVVYVLLAGSIVMCIGLLVPAFMSKYGKMEGGYV